MWNRVALPGERGTGISVLSGKHLPLPEFDSPPMGYYAQRIQPSAERLAVNNYPVARENDGGGMEFPHGKN